MTINGPDETVAHRRLQFTFIPAHPEDVAPLNSNSTCNKKNMTSEQKNFLQDSKDYIENSEIVLIMNKERANYSSYDSTAIVKESVIRNMQFDANQP